MRSGIVAVALTFGATTLAVAQQASPPPRPGVVVERVRASRAPRVPAGDRRITIVRVDPARYRFRFLGERYEGRRRPLTQWVRDFRLSGGINAGMFLPDGRSVGFMQQDGAVRSDRRPSRFDAAIGFGPRGAAVAGPGCGTTLAALRASHPSVLQARKLMVDCVGRARPWPNRRRYSAAAVGLDTDGHVVLIHARTPYRMEVLARMLAAPALRLRGVAYMEGGPEASLVVDVPSVERVREVGSWEDGFNDNDHNRAFWDLPNVIGFAPREL
jgi:hypothetical protein